MNSVPNLIHLLMQVWKQHERFVPESVNGWEWGQCLSDPPNWRWDGSKDQSGGDVHLDFFHNWSIIDQQSFLEAAVGHIFFVLSQCPRTVVQIRDNEVSVKNHQVKEMRRYTQGCMLENLFKVIIKMIEVEWLPIYKSKDGRYHYMQNAMERSDHDYELALFKSSKKQMEIRLSDLKPTMLPFEDPFADSPYFGRPNVEADRLRKKIHEIQQQIGTKEGVISSLDWL